MNTTWTAMTMASGARHHDIGRLGQPFNRSDDTMPGAPNWRTVFANCMIKRAFGQVFNPISTALTLAISTVLGECVSDDDADLRQSAQPRVTEPRSSQIGAWRSRSPDRPLRNGLESAPHPRSELDAVEVSEAL